MKKERALLVWTMYNLKFLDILKPKWRDWKEGVKTIPSVVNMKKLLENHGVSVNHWDIEAIVSLKWYESHPEETCHFNFCAILQKKWDMKFKEFG